MLLLDVPTRFSIIIRAVICELTDVVKKLSPFPDKSIFDSFRRTCVGTEPLVIGVSDVSYNVVLLYRKLELLL